jgi:hypothetical protein
MAMSGGLRFADPPYKTTRLGDQGRGDGRAERRTFPRLGSMMIDRATVSTRTAQTIEHPLEPR